MNKLVKVSASGGKAIFYINGSKVLFYQPTLNGGTAIHFNNEKTLSVETSIDEILQQLP